MATKAHKIKLYPTKSQEIFFRKSCGVARFSYNWALSKWEEWHKEGRKIKRNQLRNELIKIKRDEFPWMLEVGKACPEFAAANLEKAFQRFFDKNAKYPKFKKKGNAEGFLSVEKKKAFKLNDFKIHIPRLGMVKCSENLRFEGKVNHVIVKQVANMWFAVINIEVPDSTPALKRNESGDNQAIVGVDFGIKSMMVLSDGTIYENPQAFKKNLRRLKIRQRRVSKKQKGGKNRRKAQATVAKHHYRISCIRANAIHQATSKIVSSYDKVVIEDLNVSGMAKNGRLARALSDVSFGEMRRQLTYKLQWAGKELVVADRFFPSSKTCSGCGHKKKELKLSERTYKCENCGLGIDRDLNAARNLAAYRPTSKSEESYACGSGSSVVEMQHSPEKNQELPYRLRLKGKLVAK